MIDVFERAAVEEAARRNLDGVICGHIHQPALKTIDGILYCNDGDWIENCTAMAENHDGGLELLQWTEKHVLLASLNAEGQPATADVLPMRRAG